MKATMLAFLLLCSVPAIASQLAITDSGDVVILKDDGTWEYQSNDDEIIKNIPTNKQEFKRPKTSNFCVKSKINNSSFWINPKKWGFGKATNVPVAEYQFNLKNEGLCGAVITENIEIPIETLSMLAFENMRRERPDAKIVNREYRTVNGIEVIYMIMEFKIEDVPYNFYGYYFSNSSGSTQLVAWTSSNLAEKYQSEITNFLNGLDLK